MGSASDTRHAEEEAAATAPAERAGAPSAPSLTAAGGPERVLALQATIGNRAVARLVAESARGKDPAAPTVAAPETPPRRRLARSFWGRVWGGVKSVGSAIGSGVKTAAVAVKDTAVAVGGAVKEAAVAVGGAVKEAATWVWDGAKAAGQWAVDWLSKAGTAVFDAIKWFGAGAWTVIKAIGTVLFEKLALLGSLAWDFIRFLPFRLWRMIIQGWDLVSGLFEWLAKGVREGASLSWLWEGFKSGLNWCLETLIRLLEVFGITEALQFVWGLIFHTRNLTDAERKASELVHGEHLVPYWEVRVDAGSWMVKLGKWINSLSDPTAQERAITTMHIIQAPKDIDLETIVHELTHVVQYEKVGAVYMPQALHGQASEKGYDYGDLTGAIIDGKHYRDFNREQQAQIAEDYYIVKTTGKPGYYQGTEEELEPFIEEMRKGEF